MRSQKRFFTFIIALLIGVSFASVAVAKEDIAELKKKAEMGDADAQERLGTWYASDGDEDVLSAPPNIQEAVKWWFKAANQGHVKAQHRLGFIYATGLGVKKDPLEAAIWYRKAAEQGFAPSQSALGSMYSTGEGVPLDKPEAVKWWLKAAEQGAHTACFRLGKAYAEGQGVVQDKDEAIKWFRKADIYPPAKRELKKMLAAE